MSNSHFCYWKSERWNSTLSSQFDWQHVRLWSARLHCSPQSCKSDSNQTFQCTSNNNVILWSVVKLHMTCLHVKSSSVLESVIVESCQELCLPVSIADFLLSNSYYAGFWFHDFSGFHRQNNLDKHMGDLLEYSVRHWAIVFSHKKKRSNT